MSERYQLPVSNADLEGERLARAKKVDLIRLPPQLRTGTGGTRCSNCEFVDIKRNYCDHAEVDQELKFPAVEMCCKEWDAPGTTRYWQK